MIGIIDYKAGNPVSVLNMLGKAGIPAMISSDTGRLAGASKFILPGVSTFDHAMDQLMRSGLDKFLYQRICIEKTPVLGICIGMQLMTKSSEEGHKKGLGWIEAETVKLRVNENGTKVPHVGWNTVKFGGDSKLFEGLSTDAEFYFVHSYHLQCSGDSQVLATTSYHGPFVSAIECGHIAGVQFHPEKSHHYGLKLLKNFAANF